MALTIDIKFIVFLSIVSACLSMRQMLKNLKYIGINWNIFTTCSDPQYTSYWKLLETTIPCAAILSIVVDLSSRQCTQTPIKCKTSYNMHFISCDLQRCKYSDHIECILLPILALLCHMFVVSSTYDTFQTWSRCSSTVDGILAYVAVLGFAGVILFDSQGPDDMERNWHFICVCGLTLSVWLLHARCLLKLSHVIDWIDTVELESSSEKIYTGVGIQTRRNYTLVECIYILALAAFGVAFVYGIPMAIQLEYSVLLCVLALAIINAITFHMTYKYLFGVCDSTSRHNTITHDRDQLFSPGTSRDFHLWTVNTNTVILCMGCLFFTLPVVAVKDYTSSTDYFHSSP